jgi:hypothetical protein
MKISMRAIMADTPDLVTRGVKLGRLDRFKNATQPVGASNWTQGSK